MSSSVLLSFSVLSGITFALAYGPILRKLSLGLISPYPKADVAKRMLAATADVLVVAVMLFYYRAFASLGYLVMAVAYLLFRDAIGGGRSFGKFMFGLVVTDLETGRPCRYGAAIRRNVLFLLPGANLVAVFLESRTVVRDPQGQRLGDRFALTQVVEGFGLKDLLTGLTQWLTDLTEQFNEQFGGRDRKPGRAPVKVPLRIEIRMRGRTSAGAFDEDRVAAAMDIPTGGCGEREGGEDAELQLQSAVDQPRAFRRNVRCVDERPDA
jgi:uncharacterized RDD family membrane protein YckC